MNKTGLRDDASLAAIRSESWPRSNWNRWPPSSESASLSVVTLMSKENYSLNHRATPVLTFVVIAES